MFIGMVDYTRCISLVSIPRQESFLYYITYYFCMWVFFMVQVWVFFMVQVFQVEYSKSGSQEVGVTRLDRG